MFLINSERNKNKILKSDFHELHRKNWKKNQQKIIEWEKMHDLPTIKLFEKKKKKSSIFGKEKLVLVNQKCSLFI
jgi:hypothetical protein